MKRVIVKVLDYIRLVIVATRWVLFGPRVDKRYKNEMERQRSQVS